MQKKKERSKVGPSLFIAFIMIFSAFGVIFYGFASPNAKLEYNGYTFKQSTEGYAVKVQGQEYVFSNYPESLESINMSAGIFDLLSNKRMIFMTYNESQPAVGEIAASQFELQRSFQRMGGYSQNALTHDNRYGLPVITCVNATQFIPVIEFREGDTGIVTEGDCIIASGTYQDFNAIKDRLLLGMLGVMP